MPCRKKVRTYDWLFTTMHPLLEVGGTLGHCQEGHGLKRVTFDFCHNLSPLQKHKKLA